MLASTSGMSALPKTYSRTAWTGLVMRVHGIRICGNILPLLLVYGSISIRVG